MSTLSKFLTAVETYYLSQNAEHRPFKFPGFRITVVRFLRSAFLHRYLLLPFYRISGLCNLRVTLHSILPAGFLLYLFSRAFFFSLGSYGTTNDTPMIMAREGSRIRFLYSCDHRTYPMTPFGLYLSILYATFFCIHSIHPPMGVNADVLIIIALRGLSILFPQGSSPLVNGFISMLT